MDTRGQSSASKHQKQQQPAFARSNNARARINQARTIGAEADSNSSAGGSSGNAPSSNCSNENVYLIQNNNTSNKHQQQMLKYVNNDGAIFTLAATQNQGRQQNLLTSGSTSSSSARSSNRKQLRDFANQSPNSSTNLILESTSNQTGGGNKQNASQQHRRLQYEVHQQLQRIYGGNILKSRQQINQSNLSASIRQQQQDLYKLRLVEAKQFAAKRDQQQPAQSGSGKSKSANMANRNLSPLINQSSSSQEQTYDSLVTDLSLIKTNTDHYYDANHQHLAGLASNHQNQSQNLLRHLQPISAIPEECDDLSGSVLDPDEDEADDGLVSPDEIVLRKALQPSRSGEPGARKGLRQQSSMSSDRKSQLENLHYATVTAAALLNATANAAAAIAATEKQFKHQGPAAGSNRRFPADQRQHLLQQQKQVTNPNQSIYSDAYQEIGRKQQQARLKSQNEAPFQAMGNPYFRYKQHPASYVDLDSSPLRRAQMEPASAAMNAVYVPLTRGPGPPLPPSQAMYNLRPNVLQAPAASRQMEMLRQQRVQQQYRAIASAQARQQAALPIQMLQGRKLEQPVPTALAIVNHGGGRNAAIKADLIGRLLVNNMLSAHNNSNLPANPNQNSNQLQQQQNLSSGLMGGGANGINQTHNLRNHLNKSANNQQLIKFSKNGQKFAGAPERQLGGHMYTIPVGVAGSDTSAGSNVPLVFDRKLKRATLFDRLSRIDLTLFWWSLLIVSFFFISIVIAISRYIF